MLVLTRKNKQALMIDLAEGISPDTPVGELLKDGPIVIRLLGIGMGQVRIGVEASESFRILREELEAR